jgi:hypothetical protein
MSALVAAILAAIPAIMIKIAGRVFAESVMQKIIERLLVELIKRAAALSTNSVTHELADVVINAINTPQTTPDEVNNG